MIIKGLLKDNRGFALIITIMIISLIIPMTLEFNNTTLRYKLSSAHLKDGTVAASVAKSGYNLALALLFADASSSDFDSLHEQWADQDVLDSGAASMFEDAKCKVIIVDHSGKININSLINEEGMRNTKQIAIFRRFLGSEEFDLDEQAVGDIVNSILDWIDPDDDVTEEQGYGAENSYYQGLSKPYACKNAPFESLDELLLVKGITKGIFSRIARYLTIYGDGRININTADKLVIKALSKDIDNEMAGAIVEYRNEEKNDLSDIDWYKNVQGTGDTSLDDIITISSSYFEIISTGFKGATEKTVHVMVERKEQEELRVLSWKTG